VHAAATTDPPLATDADVIVVGLLDGIDPVAGEIADAVAGLVDAGEAKPRWRHLAHTHLGRRRLVVIGLGDPDDFDGERARQAAALALRRVRELGGQTVCWELPQRASEIAQIGEIAEAIVQGTLLGAYRFDHFRRRGEEDRPGGPERLLVSAPADLGLIVQRAELLTAAQNRARDLGNRPPNDLTPTALARYATALASTHAGLEVTVLPESEIRERGMGAFAAVAAGAEQEAQLIALRYDGPGALNRRLALIGKAVTFDSGGLWVKPGMTMPEMKFDMGGGAAVIEAVGALAQMRAPVRVLGIVGATENLVDGRAMRPSDIVTALDGTTVEINNTDAEGRLVLADCIAYARREGCDALVDIATLTGSIVSALGAFHAGLFANDDELAELIGACAARTGERVWRMPLGREYADMIKGRYAQITNLSRPRGEAAAITAAEFLHHFAGDVPWAHLDIAGVGDDGRRPYFDKGATGYGVRLLSELALSF
jgi:leucyl aminopeptidase